MSTEQFVMVRRWPMVVCPWVAGFVYAHSDALAVFVVFWGFVGLAACFEEAER